MIQSSCERSNWTTTVVEVSPQDHDERQSHQAHQQQQDLAAGGIEPPRSPGLNAAMKLNHEAVTLLMSGSEEDKAMKILKLGLTLVKSDLLVTTASAVPPPTSSSSNDYEDEGHHPEGVGQRRFTVNRSQTFRCRCSDLPARSIPLKMHAVPVHHHDDSTVPSFDETALYLYTHAFTFDFSNFDDSRNPLSSYAETLSATIIYNLALALTKKAMRTHCSGLLKRAMRLYEMCMELLRKIMMLPRNDNGEEERNLTFAFAVTVAIACSNNLGQLAYLQCDYILGQTMGKTLQYLLSVTDSSTLIADQEFSGLNQSLFSETDTQRFNLNILMFTYLPISAASA